jgi:metal-responsive CopG/Arc/MetJ family transcriptional regulator
MNMPEDERKSLTVKLKPDLLNRFNATVKRQGLKNQFVVEQLVIEYLKKKEPDKDAAAKKLSE